MTDYFVLRLTGDRWEEVHQPGLDIEVFRATSPSGAIRIALQLVEPTEGTYVAIPARSWKPVNVTAAQTTVLKLEDAK